MNFEVIKANIINVRSDIIVLPANEALKEGSGTSKAIFEAAGRKQLKKACKELGHCDIGSAVPTLAYDLDAKYIVHAVVPKWIDGEHDEYNLLCSAYMSVLNIAEIMGCESVAFPLLSAGNNGFDKKLAVQIAEESIRSFEGTALKKVFLVVYGDTMEVFMRGLGYDVKVMSENNYIALKKKEHREKQAKILADGKEAVQTILEEQMSKAVEWIKNPENQKKLWSAGIAIVQMVMYRKLPIKNDVDE